jgi:hypothetical protein
MGGAILATRRAGSIGERFKGSLRAPSSQAPIDVEHGDLVILEDRVRREDPRPRQFGLSAAS